MKEEKKLILYTDDGGEVELVSTFKVCGRCRGTGTHVNEAIDGNGLSRDDIDRLGGDDFMEDYMSGVYDVPCTECGGIRVIPVPDPERNSKEYLDQYEKQEQDRYAEEKAWRQEIRYTTGDW